MGKKTECMIRLDDITSDMNWDKFNCVKDIMNKYQICPLLGVVPDNRDKMLHKEKNREDFWEVVRALQGKGWTVAQHGTYHCYETQDRGILGINPFSEFAGLPFEVQLAKLQEGKAIFERHGVITDVFMAPGHTYDKNTLKALKECGFNVITDGLSNKPYWDNNILCIPCKLQGFNKISGIDTICIHANLLDEEDMIDLEAFCKKYQEILVSFNPKRYMNDAKKKTLYIRLEEQIRVMKRHIKDSFAHSKRLKWYLKKTSHINSNIKWLKRLVYLPLLLCYQSKE